MNDASFCDPETSTMGGDAGEAGPSCVTPTPITATTPLGSACLVDMQTTCASTLAACAADCACSTFAARCMDATQLGIVECLSAEQGTIENDLFLCIYFSKPCNVSTDTPPVVDAGAGD